MKTLSVVLVCALFSTLASAQEKQPGKEPAMDLAKVGSASRKPKDEKSVKKEIETFLKQQEDVDKKMDLNATLEYIDFPIYMMTDDSKGVVMAKEYSREEYTAMMKPFYDNMPKKMTYTHKYNITVLSDALANVVGEYTVSLEKQKVKGVSSSIVIKKGGKWMWKTMAEAGWGDEVKSSSGQGEPKR